MNLYVGSTVPVGAHRYTTRVYYDDTDAGGVVYHATYLRMAERARTEALRALGVPHAELTSQHGLLFVVRRVAIDYLAPARLDDSLVVATWPTDIGRARIELRQEIRRGDDLLAREDVTLVCVRRDEARPGGLAAAAIPDRWRTALRSLAAQRAGAAGETG